LKQYYINMSYLYEQKGILPLSIVFCKQILEINPSDFITIRRIGFLSVLQNDSIKGISKNSNTLQMLCI